MSAKTLILKDISILQFHLFFEYNLLPKITFREENNSNIVEFQRFLLYNHAMISIIIII